MRRHCCSVRVNNLSWGSTTGVDVAVQISDSSIVRLSESAVVPINIVQDERKRWQFNMSQYQQTQYVIHPGSGTLVAS